MKRANPDEIARQILAPRLDPAKVATLKGDRAFCSSAELAERLEPILLPGVSNFDGVATRF